MINYSVAIVAAMAILGTTLPIVNSATINQPVALYNEHLEQALDMAAKQPAAAPPAGCSLAGQVSLCVNHSAMQRATCAGDDLDCQCTWASKITTCYAPCITEKEFYDKMYVAKSDQENICAQAAKFGKLARDRERQRLDEKTNKGKKKEDQPKPVNPNPRDMNELNASHEALTSSESTGNNNKGDLADINKNNSPSDTKPKNPNNHSIKGILANSQGGNKNGSKFPAAVKGKPYNQNKAGKAGTANEKDSQIADNAATTYSSFSSGLVMIIVAVAGTSLF